MESYMAFAGKTHVIGISGKHKNKKGLVVEVNFLSGTIRVMFEGKSEASEDWFSAKDFESFAEEKVLVN